MVYFLPKQLYMQVLIARSRWSGSRLLKLHKYWIFLGSLVYAVRVVLQGAAHHPALGVPSPCKTALLAASMEPKG